MSEGFLMDCDTALLFFRFCRRYNIKDLQSRTFVARILVARKKAKYIPDGQAFIKGKNVLQIKGKNSDIKNNCQN